MLQNKTLGHPNNIGETSTRLSLAGSARFVSWVRSAAPYLHAFRGKTFVIAFGGEVLLSSQIAQWLAYDCNLLDALGIRLVLVHGARPQIDQMLAKMGRNSRIHANGMRITRYEDIDCVKAAVGGLRIEIQALLSQGISNTPMEGSYMRITDGNYITAKPIGIIDGVDMMSTGQIRKILSHEIREDLDQGNVVLLSTIGHSPSGEIFNLSLENVASRVAEEIQADKLVFLTEELGMVDQQGNLLSSLTLEQAEQCLEYPQKSEEIQRYISEAIHAVRHGVGRAHFVSYQKDGSLLLEFFTHTGVGTVLTKQTLYQVRSATIKDVPALLSLITPFEEDGTLVRRGRELIEAESEQFVVAELDGVLVGCAALYPFQDERMAELACLVVSPNYRREGVGDELLEITKKKAQDLGVKQLFALTTRTAHWFIERGFKQSDIEVLPISKRQLYNYHRRSIVLVKDL